MNEQLLKYIYDQTEKEGFAVIAETYSDDLKELVEAELVEVDPSGTDSAGAIRCSVTDDGMKWVEAGKPKAPAEAAPVVAPKPRGRPPKAKEEPAAQPAWVQPAPPMAAPPAPAWAMPTASQPSAGYEALRPVEQQHEHVELPNEHIEEVGQGVVSITPEQGTIQIGDIVTTSDPAYKGVIIGLTPPIAKKRTRADELLAPYHFGTMNVNEAFYIDEKLSENFTYIVSTANRVYGKQELVKVFKMFAASKVPGQPHSVGSYVFRME